VERIRVIFEYPEEGIERVQDAVLVAEVAQCKVLDLIEFASLKAKVRSIQSRYPGFVNTA
jgi:CRISPR/Cas system-associated endoribonuclease Cas2